MVLDILEVRIILIIIFKIENVFIINITMCDETYCTTCQIRYNCCEKHCCKCQKIKNKNDKKYCNECYKVLGKCNKCKIVYNKDRQKHCCKCNIIYTFKHCKCVSRLIYEHCCYCKKTYITGVYLFFLSSYRNNNTYTYDRDHDYETHINNVNKHNQVYTQIRNRFLLNYIQDFKERYYSYPNGLGYIRCMNHYNNCL